MTELYTVLGTDGRHQKFHLQDIGKLDYIIISHIHEDHCSPGTIKHLDKNAEVIIMDRRPNFVKKFLDYNKFKFKKIHLIKPYEIKKIYSDLEGSFCRSR